MECTKCNKEVCEHKMTEQVDGAPLGMVRCLTCGKAFRKPEVYSRVVGYLRPTSSWNKGKKQEFIERKTYDGPGE